MNEQPDNSTRQAGHEPLGIRVPILLMGIAGLVATIILSFGVTWWLRSALTASRPKQTPQPEAININKVKAPLEPDQRAHRLRSEQQQQALLKQYEWVDTKREFARIPIERAMELTVDRYQSSAKEKQP